MNAVTIGWFGIPSKEGGKTHYVRDGKPLCGTYMSPLSQYQWCFPDIHNAVECERCKKLKAKGKVL
jgi:hypothetical protein